MKKRTEGDAKIQVKSRGYSTGTSPLFSGSKIRNAF
jgi:hypothetical protein